MVAPNSEQKRAIEHHGGVLLEAGAGAGKTFVIINHLLFCFNSKIQDLQKISDIAERKKSLVDYLNSIVVCTFTKEAAGELQKRLKNELKAKIDSIEDNELKILWELLVENLKSLNIGTIHSFLYNLVRLGLIEGMNHNSVIISQVEWEEKIKKLVAEADFHNKALTENEVIEAAIKIFSNPLIRIEWSNYELKSPDRLDEVAKVVESQFKQLKDENRINLQQLSLGLYDEYKDKKWYEFLEQFQEIYFNATHDLNGYKVIVDFFANLKRMPPAPRKDQLQEVKDFFEEVKKLRKFLNTYYNSFIGYLENYSYIFNSYLQPLKNLFNQIEANYLNYPGIVFSDLEYYVYQALAHSKSLRVALGESYNYFIVDEFQDTSSIQFDILLNILGKDYSKLFCVGDPKQAIYGFRGGELGVIRDCKSKVPQVLNLKMNYRSLPGIVDFNNSFFSHVLSLGSGFEGIDHHSVEFSSQTTSNDYEDSQNKNFELIDIEIENEEDLDSFKSDQINLAEARYICDRIICELRDQPEKDIAILYKKLAPSNYLIKLLMEHNIAFTSIIKVPFSDEPIIGIHYVVSRYLIDESDSIELTYLFIKEYLSYFDLSLDYDQESLFQMIKKIDLDLKYLNIETAFCRFFTSLGVASSKVDLIGDTLSSLYNLSRDSLTEFYKLIKDFGSYTQKSTLSFGENAQVTIMTAHASKGLEFDTVFLGGISTNAKTYPDLSKIGMFPESIKWREHKGAHEFLTSPAFCLEKQVLKNKEFSESKRLLYVANTRAKQQLIICRVLTKEIKLRIDKNSWLNAFLSFFDNKPYSFTKNDYKLSFENESLQKNSYFHTDRRSLISFGKQNEITYCLLPELSVTKLTSVIDCSRKFYFRHVLNIDDNFLSNTQGENQNYINQKSANGEAMVSSSERGTELHKTIEEYLTNDESELFSSEHLSEKRNKWVGEYLKTYLNSEKQYVEYEMKFPFFDHMISGTVDLVVIDKNIVRIIDFKTGKTNSKNLEKYFYQLKLYAHGLIYQNIIESNSQIELSIFSIDEEKIITYQIDKDSLALDLKTLFIKLNQFNQVNLDSCQYCSYVSICDQTTEA